MKQETPPFYDPEGMDTYSQQVSDALTLTFYALDRSFNDKRIKSGAILTVVI